MILKGPSMSPTTSGWLHDVSTTTVVSTEGSWPSPMTTRTVRTRRSSHRSPGAAVSVNSVPIATPTMSAADSSAVLVPSKLTVTGLAPSGPGCPIRSTRASGLLPASLSLLWPVYSRVIETRFHFLTHLVSALPPSPNPSVVTSLPQASRQGKSTSSSSASSEPPGSPSSLSTP